MSLKPSEKTQSATKGDEKILARSGRCLGSLIFREKKVF